MKVKDLLKVISANQVCVITYHEGQKIHDIKHSIRFLIRNTTIAELEVQSVYVSKLDSLIHIIATL